MKRNQALSRCYLTSALVSFVIATLLTPAAGSAFAPGAPEGNGESAGQIALTGLGEVATAGQLQITVLAVEEGDTAWARVSEASTLNEPPIDGLAYIATSLRIENRGTTPIQLDNNDFEYFDSAGIGRRFTGVIEPSPSVSGALEAGSTVEGWSIGIVTASDPVALLHFDSLTLTGSWADAMLALRADAQLSEAQAPAVAANELGKSPEAPAVVGETISTAEWAVTIEEVVIGQAVYDLYPASDYRTTALGMSAPEVIPYWLALRVSVTNNRIGQSVDFLPPTAFALSFADGDTVEDVRVLTPPRPDASASYMAGALQVGWVAFELPAAYDGSLLRFLPFEADADPRFLTWGDGSAPSGPAIEQIPEEVETLAIGDEVETIEDLVRLRASASTGAEVVEEMSAGTRMVVTGGAVEADGYSWYPVETVETGEQGFVAANFIRKVT